MILNDFKKYLLIDRSSLDEEVSKQPDLYFKVSEEFAQAVSERDSLKEVLATVDANLDSEIRGNPSDKLTEPQIKHRIQTHPKHAEAFWEYAKAKRVADMWGNLKDAFHQRRYLLRDLVQLAVANFFESSSVTAENVYNKQAMERLAEARRNKLTSY